MSSSTNSTDQIQQQCRNLVLRVKDCAQRLTKAAHTAGANEQAFDETNDSALLLCESIEMTLIHGMKIREFNGNLPLWGLLERLEILTPPCIPLRNTVGAVACIASLRTPVAKARAWVRQILNAGSLDEALMFLTAQTQLMKSFYSINTALLCNYELSTMLVAVVRSFKVHKFNFKVDDAALNSLPTWLTRHIKATMHPSSRPGASDGRHALTSSQQQQQQQQQRGGASRFDSFFKSMESGFDKLIGHVDAAAEVASKFLNEQLENNTGNNNSTNNIAGNINSRTTTGAGAGGMSGSATGADGAAKQLTRRLSSRRNVAVGHVPFYGSSLRDLLLNERRSAYAYLSPVLGIPNQALKLINFVSSCADEPGLFRQRASLAAVNELRRFIEEERGLPASVDIASATFVLIQWLNQLPEPLLGFEHYDAILACQELEDEDARLRNLALLVSESPWYAKPLLLKVVHLFHKLLLPEHAEINGLNSIAVSVLTTPFLLRPYSPTLDSSSHSSSSISGSSSGIGGAHTAGARRRDADEVDRAQMAATAAGSTTVEQLLTHHSVVFKAVAEDVGHKQQLLLQKCGRIRNLQHQFSLALDVSAVVFLDDGDAFIGNQPVMGNDAARSSNSNSSSSSSSSEADIMEDPVLKEQRDLIVQLWRQLEMTERIVSVSSSDGSTTTAGKNDSNSNANSNSGDHSKSTTSDSNNNSNDSTLEPGRLGAATSAISATAVSAAATAAISASTAATVAAAAAGGGTSSTTVVEQDLSCSTLLPESVTLEELLTDARWDRCGFSPPESPLQDFSTQHGHLALKCITGFLRRYREKGATLAAEFCLNRKAYCTLTQLALRLVHNTAEVLQLLPSPDDPQSPPSTSSSFGAAVTAEVIANSAGTTSMQRLAKKSVWLLLSEEECFQEVFDMQLLSFDDAWRACTEQRSELPSRDTTPQALMKARTTVWDIIAKRKPRNIDQMWQQWMEARLAERQEWERMHPSPAYSADGAGSGGHVGEARDVRLSSTAVAEAKITHNTVATTAGTSTGAGANSCSVVAEAAAEGMTLSPDAALDAQQLAQVLAKDPLATHQHGRIPSSGAHFGGSSILKYEHDSYMHLQQSPCAASTHSTALAPATASNDGVHGDGEKSDLGQHDREPKDVAKSLSGIVTHVRGGSIILSEKHIEQLEAALPKTHQCYDWNLLYRLSTHGANLGTLLHRAQGSANSLLVVRDSNGTVFGGLITEQLKGAHSGEKDKYYGNGTIGVWSFHSGTLKFYPWSFKNSYFLLSSPEALALGGGGHFAIYLDGDLNNGSSGDCDTFDSPCLASQPEFTCHSCELFGLTASLGL